MKNNNKSVTFSREIDDLIAGFALVCAFILLGIIILFFPELLGVQDKTISYIFIIIGSLGLFSEFSKLKITFEIKGLNDIFASLILGMLVFYFRRFLNLTDTFWNIIFQVFYLFVVLLVLFGVITGIIRVVYSVYLLYKKNKKAGAKFYFSVLKIVTDLAGVVLIIAQVIKNLSS